MQPFYKPSQEMSTDDDVATDSVILTDFSMAISEDKPKLFEALSKFQSKCQHPKKTATVNYSYQGRTTKYEYATLDNCITTNQKLLGECGLALSQFPITRDGKVGVLSLLVHSGGEWIKGLYLIKPVNDKAQEMGSAITYLRRYSYSSILGFASEPDEDGSKASGTFGSPEAKTTNKRIGERKVDTAKAADKKLHTQKEIEMLLKNNNTIEGVLALWTELTKDQQTNPKIKGWFSMRKAQIADETAELKKQNEKEIDSADGFIQSVSEIANYLHLQNWYKKHKERILMLPAEEYSRVSTAIDNKEIELRAG